MPACWGSSWMSGSTGAGLLGSAGSSFTGQLGVSWGSAVSSTHRASPAGTGLVILHQRLSSGGHRHDAGMVTLGPHLLLGPPSVILGREQDPWPHGGQVPGSFSVLLCPHVKLWDPLDGVGCSHLPRGSSLVPCFSGQAWLFPQRPLGGSLSQWNWDSWSPSCLAPCARTRLC